MYSKNHFIIVFLAWTVLQTSMMAALEKNSDGGDLFLQSIISKLKAENEVYLPSTPGSVEFLDENEFGSNEKKLKQPFHQYGFVDNHQQLDNQLNLQQFGSDWSQLLKQPSNVPYDVHGQSFPSHLVSPNPHNVKDLFSSFENSLASTDQVQPSNVDNVQQNNAFGYGNLNLQNVAPGLLPQNGLAPQVQANYGGVLPYQGENINTAPVQTDLNGAGTFPYAQNSLISSMLSLFQPAWNHQPLVDDNLIDQTLNAMGSHGVPLDNTALIGGHSNGLTKYPVEPLFVAMAGFLGIAVIFMSCVLFLPKLFTSPPEFHGFKGTQELAALTKLAVKAVDGQDCTERIACEVGRAMRSIKVEDKPIKVLELMLPTKLAQQLAQIRKAIADKRNCHFIQCKPSRNNKLKFSPYERIESKAEVDPITILKMSFEPSASTSLKTPTASKPASTSHKTATSTKPTPSTKWYSTTRRTTTTKASSTTIKLIARPPKKKPQNIDLPEFQTSHPQPKCPLEKDDEGMEPEDELSKNVFTSESEIKKKSTSATATKVLKVGTKSVISHSNTTSSESLKNNPKKQPTSFATKNNGSKKSTTTIYED